MKIEFKVDGYDHRQTFQALTDMLDVIDRGYTLNAKVCAVMDADEEYLPDFVNIDYIDNGFQVEFTFHKSTGKISLKSRPVQ